LREPSTTLIDPVSLLSRREYVGAIEKKYLHFKDFINARRTGTTTLLGSPITRGY